MDTTASLWLPAPESTMAGDIDALFHFILYASIFFFALVVALTAYFVVKYRRRGKYVLTSGTDHNTALEVLWTVIPTILIIIVFFWGFRDYIRLYVAPGDAIEVKVGGQQWFWTFDYPEGASSLNDLTVPVNQPVKLLMSSKDVIHSFYVPNFRIKMDVLPNRYTSTWFQATRIGEYDLFCTEYCGKGHSEMIGKVHVVSQEDYEKFIAAGVGPAEGETLADFGRRLFTKKACITCHTIDGSKNVGPTFLGLWASDQPLSDGSRVTVDENYIRESVLSPRAKVVAGYDPVMPTYQGILKEKEIEGLIAFIKSLENQ
jgi:cytochrome c oxidase subunit 2